MNKNDNEDDDSTTLLFLRRVRF